MRVIHYPNIVGSILLILLTYPKHTYSYLKSILINLLLFRNFEEGSGGEMQIDETEGEKAGTM